MTARNTIGRGAPSTGAVDSRSRNVPQLSGTAVGRRGLHGRAVDMADLVSYVENWTGRPLLDKTGIQGRIGS